MTFVKETLTFRNSPRDDLAVYVDGHLQPSDTDGLERAIKKEALKYIARESIKRVVTRMEAIRSILNSYGI